MPLTPLQPMKPLLLLVDDNEMNLEILREELGGDCDLVTAGDGAEAVQIAASGSVRLILMDVMMPVMNGYDACRAIKALPQGDRLHVVLISAKASAGERVQGYDAGADDYLVKPFDGEELHAKVRVQLRLIDALQEVDLNRARLSANNALLHDRVEEQTRELVDARDLTVFALANLADSRDPETGEHLERIRHGCRILATRLAEAGDPRVDAAFVDQIYKASPLHDIGKVGVPDAVLLKPGRLTPGEFEQMKRHSGIGAKALADVAGQARGGGGCFLEMAIEIARSHHERWDGGGYPDGLAGEAIPLAARICAVADVFDALTSSRVYKEAYPPQKAREIIREGRGGHFDPAVVDAFEAAYGDLVAARARLGDAG